jgi:hypothetical protein
MLPEQQTYGAGKSFSTVAADPDSGAETVQSAGTNLLVDKNPKTLETAGLGSSIEEQLLTSRDCGDCTFGK